MNVLSSGEAARILEVDRRTLINRERRGQIAPVAVAGGRRIYKREDVLKLKRIMAKEKQAKHHPGELG